MSTYDRNFGRAAALICSIVALACAGTGSGNPASDSSSFRLQLTGPVEVVGVPAREPMVVEHPTGALFVSGYSRFRDAVPVLWKSVDRGASWNRVNVGTAADGAIGNSDVDLTIAPDGTLYFLTMGFDRSVSEGTHVAVGVSRDVGATWTWSLLSKTRFDDRPWVKIAPDGTAHVIWNDGSGVRHTVGQDGGRTWRERARIHPHGGSSHLAISPRGDIAVRVMPISASGAKFDEGVDLIAVSTDGGSTWQKRPAPGQREWSSPRGPQRVPRWLEPLAWDASGALYSAWTNLQGFWLARSLDLGATWKTWRIAESSAVQFYPYLVARGRGELAAAWFNGMGDSMQVRVARLQVDGNDSLRVNIAPPFQPDSWAPSQPGGAAPTRDPAGEYVPVAFLRDGTLAVVSPIQNFSTERFGFAFWRVQ